MNKLEFILGFTHTYESGNQLIHWRLHEKGTPTFRTFAIHLAQHIYTDGTVSFLLNSECPKYDKYLNEEIDYKCTSKADALRRASKIIKIANGL